MVPKFTSLVSRVIPLLVDNIDTDQIIPARFLKVIDKQGLGEHLFADWRYGSDGLPLSGFPLNQAENQGAEVLLAGHNFGCGSSREHAPWALMGWGFRALISTGFADIFRNNCLKNGLLPVQVDRGISARLLADLERDPMAKVAVDLESTTLRLPDGSKVGFPIDSFSRHCLLEGLDQLGYILSFQDRIEAYEGRARCPLPV
ncbi:MAG TPA: 3-isopropylmalate dehydratase small subunit [Polyangiaceae bacterium]|jgi:3-isopropylmalate/(R)-2-methylmalate dehydratase small subunit